MRHFWFFTIAGFILAVAIGGFAAGKYFLWPLAPGRHLALGWMALFLSPLRVLCDKEIRERIENEIEKVAPYSGCQIRKFRSSGVSRARAGTGRNR